jgi:hypothetical protein
MAGRTLTVVLSTAALLVAGPIVTRTLATATPTDDAHRTAERVRYPISDRWRTASAVRHLDLTLDSLSDEAAMALVGSALLALAAAVKKAA